LRVHPAGLDKAASRTRRPGGLELETGAEEAGARSANMLVGHILGSKGREIVAIAAEATLCEAAELLATRRIGAVVVQGARGELAGIFSERDIVRAISRDGAAALSKPVDRFMTRDVATCVESDSIDELMEMMTRGRFRHVPVVDCKGALVGIVSIGDVVKSRIEETVREAATLRQYIGAAS
jgi:CBS domain-containing protein